MTSDGSPGGADEASIVRRMKRWRPLRWVYTLYLDACTYLSNHVVAHVPFMSLRHLYYRRIMRWRIGKRSHLHERLRVSGPPAAGALTVGDHVVFGCGAQILGLGDCPQATVTIGDNVNLAFDAMLIVGGHNLATDSQFEPFYRPVKIEDHAVVFARATIIMCTVGRGAVVLPGAVVTRDVAPFEIVGGVPARRVGMREPQNDPAYRLDWHWRFH